MSHAPSPTMELEESAPRRVIGVVRGALDRYRRHRADLLGAGIALYSLLSFAPLLLVAVAVAALVLGEGDARIETLRSVRHTLGARAAQLIGESLDRARTFGAGASTLGALLFLFGSSRVFAQLRSALDAVWEVRVDTSLSLRASVFDTVRSYLLALCIGVLVAILIAASTLGHVLVTRAADLLGWDGVAVGLVIRVIHAFVSFLALACAFALTFHFLPRVRIAWRDVRIGAAIAAALLSLGNGLLAAYFQYVDVGAGYGAAGSIIVFLVWLLYCAQILMLGSEITAVVAARRRERTTEARASRTGPPTAHDAARLPTTTLLRHDS